MFGAVPCSDLDGDVWLLGTDALATRPLAGQFLRQSRFWLTALHEGCAPILHNVIDARNTLHIRWLQWLGFTFIKRHEVFGVEGRPFLEFMRLHHV
jgi:hypothetical protein